MPSTLVLGTLAALFTVAVLGQQFIRRHNKNSPPHAKAKTSPLLALLALCGMVWAPVMAVNYWLLMQAGFGWWLALALADLTLLALVFYLETKAQRIDGAAGWMAFGWLLLQPFIVMLCGLVKLVFVLAQL
ncbi:hypothetical protein [Alkanindiges illinoisensis]|uniref:hypothetical protein n=1 Tax=Alkanindiges illinoisensis TaxID=197183 RepID=UPI0004788EE2|nr:hypothetical protein [Alkanindiges illinoisensis]